MTAKRQARFEMLRESSKERIGQAALELFAHKGYANTSISQIASAAGISKGLMYNYYSSKEALLESIVHQGFKMGDDMLAAGLAKSKQPAELLKFLVEASFAAIREKPVYWKLLSALAHQEEVMKAIAPDVEEKKKQNLELGEKIFRELGYPKPLEQALLFAATMDGVLLHFIFSPGEYQLDGVKDLLIETFCKPFSKKT